MIGKLFHTPGTKEFSVRPRFHDPDKEDRDNRERRIKEELGIADEKPKDLKNFRAHVKGQFRNPDAWQSKSSAPARKAQNKRLIWLFIVLALIFYLFFYSDFMF